jgi:acetolactate synthase-1/2/3 large subunit
VRRPEDLAKTIHLAFLVATTGRPGPVLIDIPKDVQFADAEYCSMDEVEHPSYKPIIKPEISEIEQAIELMSKAQNPIFYTGGGVINSGPEASHLLRELVSTTGFPITSTLMGLGAFPASDDKWLGMLGMHGTYEANMAMHDCDLIINVGARFDDRVTGRLDAFSPNSKKIHIDIDPTSINKTIDVDVAVIGDCAHVLENLLILWKSKGLKTDTSRWWEKINEWRQKKSLNYSKSKKIIKPQYAVERLYELTKDRDTYITTEVGQHQMWAAQHYHFAEPNRWMTSGGLGTMGYGLPAAIGTQVAFPKSTVIDIAGEASVLMNMQELSTAVQHKLPIKVFILNNQYMGMVRQWQELLHGGRYSHSYTDSLPDFVKLAEAYGAHGVRAQTPDELDSKINEMLDTDLPVLFDCVVDKDENCYPMIPSGAAHNEMLFNDDGINMEVGDEGKVLI